MKKPWIPLLVAAFSLVRGSALSAQETALKVSAREPFLVDYARKAGYFSAAGLAVEVLISSVAARPGVEGSADAALEEAVGPLSAFLRGKDIRVLARLYPSYGFFGVSRFPASEASKIKTATRGVSGGFPSRRLTALLKHLGAADAKLTASKLPDEETYKLLEDGQTDFILVNSEPLLARIRAEKKYHVIEPENAYKGCGFDTVIFATQGALSAKGPALEKFVAAMLEALEDAAAKPEAFLAFLIGDQGFGPQKAAAVQALIARAAADDAFVPEASALDALASTIEIPGALKTAKSAGGIAYPEYAAKWRKARPGRAQK